MKRATTNGVTYEGVIEFVYLGTLISNGNKVQKVIQRRNLASNRTYFAALSLIRNRLLTRATKIRLIRPAVTCGAETWTMTKKEEQALHKMREWKIRTNRELEELNKGENIVKWIEG
jgi:hypothetical protein